MNPSDLTSIHQNRSLCWLVALIALVVGAWGDQNVTSAAVAEAPIVVELPSANATTTTSATRHDASERPTVVRVEPRTPEPGHLSKAPATISSGLSWPTGPPLRGPPATHP